MSSPATSIVVPDDSELQRIAVAPHQRLFPYLNRSSAFGPLILACCVFPALQLLTVPTLDDDASLWGLRALAVGHASTSHELIQPGVGDAERPLIFQPPLAAWLNGITVRIFGPAHPLSCALVSLLSTALAIWLVAEVARRLGGANAALSSAILLCSFPQTLKMAISPSDESISLLLMLTTVVCFQRHLEGRSRLISPSLIFGGVAWGLSLLSLGPAAVMIPAVFVAHATNQQISGLSVLESRDWKMRLAQGWPVLRSALMIAGIGMAIGAWWEILMLREHGMNFWSSWYRRLPSDCLDFKLMDWHSEHCRTLMPTWQDWVNMHALLIGWALFGLRRCWNEMCLPTSEMMRRRVQLLLLWWGLALAARILVALIHPAQVVNTTVWNLVLLAPSILLAALGVNALIERSLSIRSETLLILVLFTLTAYRLTGTWWLGAVFGLAALILFVVIPRIRPGLPSGGDFWAEQDWRQALQIVVYGSVLTCLAMGIRSEDLRFQDEDHLAELRDRLDEIPDVHRISLIATRDPIPTSLRYLLRCRWPQVILATNEGWDSGLTRAMNDEAQNPASRFLILEWTRRNVHLSVDTFQGWQMKPVGDPLRFHGRRLSLLLIEPQT